jgi:hypothetical protein
MTLLLAITDAQDGTGGTATITGSAGAANAVYYAPFTGMPGNMTWTLAGTRTGDGTVPLTIGTGYFLFHLTVNGALGPIANKAFTDAIDPVHFRCLIGARTRLNQLSMTGLDPTKLMVKWLPRAIDIDLTQLPYVCISPPGFEIDVSTVLNEDDYLYPVIVAFFVKQNQDSVANLKLVLKWREQALRALANQRWPGITETMWAVPKPMNVLDPDSYVSRGILLSALGFGNRIRQTRGLT